MPKQSIQVSSKHVYVFNVSWLSTRLGNLAETGNGILSELAYLGCGKTSFCNGEKITTYRVEFQVKPGFGIPGAISVKNQCKQRFFLQSASLKTPNNNTVQFDCNSWVYPVIKTDSARIFFSNTVCFSYKKQITRHFCLRYKVIWLWQWHLLFVVAEISSEPNTWSSTGAEEERTS